MFSIIKQRPYALTSQYRLVGYLARGLVLTTSATIIATSYTFNFIMNNILIIPLSFLMYFLGGKTIGILDLFAMSQNMVLAIYNNFTYLTLDLANKIFEKFNFPKIALGYTHTHDKIKNAIDLRNKKIEYEKVNAELSEKYCKDLSDMELILSEDPILMSDYKSAVAAYSLHILDEYKYFLIGKGLDVSGLSLPADAVKLNHLISWYILRTRNRLVTWDLPKEFALKRMQNNTDGFLDGVSDEKIAELEAHSEWCCSITSEIMRNPVYVILSNGENKYYEKLNLEKWISRAVSNPDEREIIPENRERISQIFCDQNLQNDIKNAIAASRAPSSRTSKLFYASLNIISSCIQLIPNALSFLVVMNKQFCHIVTIDQSLIERIENPYECVDIPEYGEIDIIKKQTPLWKHHFNHLLGRVSHFESGISFQENPSEREIEILMLEEEVDANVTITEVAGVAEILGQNIVVFRDINANFNETERIRGGNYRIASPQLEQAPPPRYVPVVRYDW